MPDDNVVMVPEFVEASNLVRDIVIESHYGSNSGDPRLAASSRQTFALASIVALILAGIGEEKFNALGSGGTLDAVADNSAIEARVAELESKVGLSPDIAKADTTLTGDLAAIGSSDAKPPILDPAPVPPVV